MDIGEKIHITDISSSSKETLPPQEKLGESGSLERSVLGEPTDIVLPGEDPKQVRILATRKKEGYYHVVYAPLQDGIANPDNLELAIIPATEQPASISLSEENLPTSFKDIFQKIKEGINSKDLDYKKRFLWTNRVILSGAVLSWVTRHALKLANSAMSTPDDLPIFESIRNNSQFFYPFIHWDKISDFGIFSGWNLILPEGDDQIRNSPKKFAEKFGPILLWYGITQEVLLPILTKKLAKNINPYGVGDFDPLDIVAEVGGALFSTASRNELLKRVQKQRTTTIDIKLREKISEHLQEEGGLNTLFNNQTESANQDQEKDNKVFGQLYRQMKELMSITEDILSDIEGSLGNNQEARELLKQFSRAYTTNFIRKFCFSQVKVENEGWAWKTAIKKHDTAQLLDKYRTKL